MYKLFLKPPVKVIQISTIDGISIPKPRLFFNYPVNLNHVISFFPDEIRISSGKSLKTIFLPSITFKIANSEKEEEWVFEKEGNRDDVYNEILEYYSVELNVKLR